MPVMFDKKIGAKVWLLSCYIWRQVFCFFKDFAYKVYEYNRFLHQKPRIHV